MPDKAKEQDTYQVGKITFMSVTPFSQRPLNHWKKLTQLALSSFMPSAAPNTSR